MLNRIESHSKGVKTLFSKHLSVFSAMNKISYTVGSIFSFIMFTASKDLTTNGISLVDGKPTVDERMVQK